MEQNSILHTTLSLDSDIPLYAQLVGIIKRSISTGALPVGALLPSEAELCRCLSISRNTVRQAIGELEEEGLVVRKRGRGTFVADTVTHVALSHPEVSIKFIREGKLQYVTPGDGQLRAAGLFHRASGKAARGGLTFPARSATMMPSSK